MNKYQNIAAVIVALLVGLFIGQTLVSGPEQEVESEIDDTIYTCSMHPQIRQDEPGDCPICGMDLIPATSTAQDDPTVLEMTEAAVALANVQTTVVGGSLAGSAPSGPALRLSGKIKADERLAASQVAHVPGRIERLYVSFTGESVVAGQKLAEIYSPQLVTAQRELLEAIDLADLNPALLGAARDKLRYWKIDSTTIAQLESSRSIQETFTLRADATGVVTDRMVAVGDYVNQGEPLFSLVNLSRVWATFDLFERDLGRVEIGDLIYFTSPALPGREYELRIDFVDPILDDQTRVATARGELRNPQGQLKPEMLIYGQIPNSQLATSTSSRSALDNSDRPAEVQNLSVPKSAVLWTGTRSVVYVKMPDRQVPTYQFREVELGESIGDVYRLLSGIEAGEEVVTFGNFAIDAAAQLNNQASMMNRDVLTAGDTREETVAPNFQEETPAEFQSQLADLLPPYLALKDALVTGDAEAAAEALSDWPARLEAIDMSLLEGDGHHYWMEQLVALRTHAAQIMETAELEEQREQFVFLSAALIAGVRAFGLDVGQSVFIQHCPMAQDNAGADWLATQEEIRNPYFGDAMLTCGYTKEIIQP